MHQKTSHQPTQKLAKQQLLELLHELADLSGEAILPHFRSELDIQDKAEPGSFDPVTLADKNGEQVIRKKLLNEAPHHGVIGEEFDDKSCEDIGSGNFHWVIDPIDGTRGFMSGFPTWGTLIGLLKEREPYFGLMNQPFTKERYWSDAEKSYYKGPDGEYILKTRPCNDINNAVMSSTAPEMFKNQSDIERFTSLQKRAKLTRFGGDCYAYCLLAAGHIDLVVEVGLKIYDIAPLIPIVENAGGVVTDWEGSEATDGGRVIAAGDPKLHEAVLKQLSG